MNFYVTTNEYTRHYKRMRASLLMNPYVTTDEYTRHY